MNSAYGLIIVQPRSFRFPISVAADEWRLFGGAGKRAGKLFLHSVLDVTSLMQLDTSNTKAVSANVRLRYNYRPDSDFYIIYNVGHNLRALHRQTLRRCEKLGSR